MSDIAGRTTKWVVLKNHTLIGGKHIDRANPVHLLESDAKELRNGGRVLQIEDGEYAVFSTEAEAKALIEKLGWKPEEYEADRIAAEKAAAKAKR